jgi:ketopantoate reductase
VRVPVVGPDTDAAYETVLVFVQAVHVDGIVPTLAALNGVRRFAFMGNNTRGFDGAAQHLGRERVLSGFGSIGGTWRDGALVYVDSAGPGKPSVSRLILGAPYKESVGELDLVVKDLRSGGREGEGLDVVVYDPIQDWHLTHAAFITGLAGAMYRCDLDRFRLADDRATLNLGIRAVKEAFHGLRQSGHQILPSRLRTLLLLPAFVLRPRLCAVLRSDFAEIGLAGHANAARDEMRTLALDTLSMAKSSGVRCDALRELATAI